jgi:PAS domain S-box-containing protein
VNEAFETRYGYSRGELIGRTILETGIWDDPQGRSVLLREIREHGHVRNRATLLRNRSGKAVETVYSAQTIQLDGQQCILAVTEDPQDGVRPHALLASRVSFAG